MHSFYILLDHLQTKCQSKIVFMQEKLEERLVQYKTKNDVLVRQMVRHLQHWERSFSTIVSPVCDHMRVLLSL